MLGIIAIVTLIVCAQALPAEDLIQTPQSSYVRYNTEARLAEDGYYAESYDVVTSDGYVLEVNRIPVGRFQSAPVVPGSKPVVFLMHGLQSSGLSYIFAGPGLSLAYLLADAGYDVWLGNGRGALNSRRHVKLNPDNSREKQDFFDYSFEDIATKDLPAMIDYVLQYTNKKQLNYIGHSQGGTAFLVLNSLMPEYNAKFLTVHLLAGVGYQRYFPSTFLNLAAISTDLIFAFGKSVGTVELLGPSDNKEEVCRDNANSVACLLESVTDLVNDMLGPFEMVAGAALKQYAHYGQNIRDRAFRRWNYNPVGNLRAYGTLTPPSYDLKKINVDMTMHYTVGDTLLDERDVLNMAKDIPNCKVRRVARDSFSHTDFVTGDDSKELVSDYVIAEINKKNKAE